MVHRSEVANNCWFSVSRPIKIKINQNRSIDKVQRRTKCKFIKTQVIFQVIFQRDMRRNVLPKSKEICMEAPCRWHQHGGRKRTETSVTEFCYKSLNWSLEELENIKIILFLSQIPRDKSLFYPT